MRKIRMHRAEAAAVKEENGCGVMGTLAAWLMVIH